LMKMELWQKKTKKTLLSNRKLSDQIRLKAFGPELKSFSLKKNKYYPVMKISLHPML
jgi:hypothetical protein